MYHQLYNLDALEQKFTTSSGIVQFVNQSTATFYIDDGEERREIATGRSLDGKIIGSINQFIFQEHPFI